MASKKTVTLDNVASLGPERLAAILVDLAEADAEVKRRLRLELSAQIGGDSIAAEIGKRITALRKARSFVDWQKRRDFVKDLDLQRAMIVDRVAQTHADLALDLMWRFMDLAEPVINRVDDSNGSVGDVFQTACEDLGAIAVKARPDPVCLADRVLTAVSANDYGVFDGLVTAMIPALGDTGTAHLKNRLALADRPRKAGGRDLHTSVVRRALQDIADAQTDVDAYIALVPVQDRSWPYVGAEIGRRLLAACRTIEALAALENARPNERAERSGDDDHCYLSGYRDGSAWEEIYIEALDAAGQKEQAQQLRWAAFEERLSTIQLLAYLKKQPDFDDVEAEERAMRHALDFKSFPAALDFLRGWPDQARAARLVLTRTTEIDGNLYYLLDPAAQLIEGKDPLAATLLRRAMIEDTLNGAKSSRYKHAARHLLECLSLASSVRDFGTFETHETFASRLHAKHGRDWLLGSGSRSIGKQPTLILCQRIAKRTEAAHDVMIGSICENPLTIRAIIGWRDPLNERKMLLRDIIDPDAAYGSGGFDQVTLGTAETLPVMSGGCYQLLLWLIHDVLSLPPTVNTDTRWYAA